MKVRTHLASAFDDFTSWYYQVPPLLCIKGRQCTKALHVVAIAKFAMPISNRKSQIPAMWGHEAILPQFGEARALSVLRLDIFWYFVTCDLC